MMVQYLYNYLSYQLIVAEVILILMVIGIITVEVFKSSVVMKPIE